MRYSLRHRGELSGEDNATELASAIGIKREPPHDSDQPEPKRVAVDNAQAESASPKTEPGAADELASTISPSVIKLEIIEPISLVTPEPDFVTSLPLQAASTPDQRNASEDTAIINATSLVKSEKRRSSVSSVHQQVRLPSATSPTQDALTTAASQAPEKHRTVGVAESKVLKDKIAEVEAQLKEREKDKARATALWTEERAEKEKSDMQGRIAELEDALRKKEEIYSANEEGMREQVNLLTQEAGLLREDIDELKAERTKHQHNTKTQEDEIRKLNAEVLDLVRDIYEQKKLTKITELEKQGLEYRIKFDRKNFDKAMEDAALKQKGIDDLKRSHRRTVREKDAELKAQVYQQKEMRKQIKKALTRKIEKLERVVSGMHFSYSDLYEKNTVLWDKVEAIAEAGSFGGISDMYRMMLDKLKGKPLMVVIKEMEKTAKED